MPRSAPPAELSREQARALALAAQGFDRPRPGRVTRAALARTIRRQAVLQLDFVNVLLPAHYLVPYSRLGPYRRELLDDLAYVRHELTESWAREAALIPVESWPLFAERRAAHVSSRSPYKPFLAKSRPYLENVLEQVKSRGPLGPADLPEPRGYSGRPGGWTYAQAALEHLFGRGELCVAARAPNFSKTYDLAERVIPASERKRRVAPDEAVRELVRQASAALGVASAGDLADYWRLPARDLRPRLAELVEEGELHEVRIEGSRAAHYRHAAARLPRRIDAQALLAPWDPLIDRRDRTQLLFDFDYRNEIFVTAAKRKWGYYVLPFLLGDRLVARVDLKSDRPGSRLLVLSAHLERSARATDVAPALAAELRTLAAWLGLDAISVERKGNLARPLSAVV